MRSDPLTPRLAEVACLDALCDDVVQRLFAAGVGIDAIVAQLPDDVLAARLAGYVAELDDTINEIRTRTVGLRTELGQYR